VLALFFNKTPEAMMRLFCAPGRKLEGLPCAVCCVSVQPSGGVPAMRTTLQNFPTACDFLLKYGVIEPSGGVMGFRDLCKNCLSLVLACDSLLSL
jgi:hypothetical protein